MSTAAPLVAPRERRTARASDIPAESSTGDLIHRLDQRWTSVFARKVGKHHKATPRQISLLKAAADNDGASQTDLVRATGVDRSTVAEITRRMVRRGLLTRRRTREDARTYAVKITEEGAKLVAATAAATAAAQEELLGALAKPERKLFLDMLDRVAARVDET